jgi:hypothetical protein
LLNLFSWRSQTARLGGAGDAEYFGDTVSVRPRSGAKEAENTAYAGQKLEEEQGMPAGRSIIGNRCFTPGSATDEGSEMQETVLISNEVTVAGRLSWEQLFRD